MVARININVADVREKGRFKSERMTQALFNEEIEIIREGDKYTKVKLSDGYIGHINRLFITHEDAGIGDDYVIWATLTPAYSKPDTKSPIFTLLPFAAQLKAIDYKDDFAVVNSIRYGKIYIKKEDLIPADKTPKLTIKLIPDMIECALRFMGVPYLWGGKSFFGLDCSGFTQVVYKYYGINIPRDSKDQAKKGRPVNRDEIQPGDLLFFKKHVGIAISNTDYLHSSLSQGGVHINNLEPHKKGYIKFRDHTLRAVRRYVES
jgi:gamma-D-glutamyl-L-lysine dipeptidyl-peptidase